MNRVIEPSVIAPRFWLAKSSTCADAAHVNMIFGNDASSVKMSQVPNAEDRSSANSQFDSQFDCFVINLKHQPERLKAFFQRNSPSNLHFHHFEAVDGAQFRAGDIPDGIVAKGTHNYSPGAIGAAMSHLALWQLCIEQNKSLVVFEDDAYLRYDFKAQLTSLSAQVVEWDFILLGYNTDSVLELSIAPGIDFGGLFSVRYPTINDLTGFAKTNNPVGLAPLNLAMGLCGYAVAPGGAEQLIEHCFPMDTRPVHLRCINRTFLAYGIDCMMGTFYRNIRAFVCIPPLVMTPNDQNASTIQRAT